jgi:hypothetical protein
MQQDSSKSRYQTIEQLKKLLSEGYVINRVSYPPTSDGAYSIMIDLMQPNGLEECLLTVFGEEAIALSEFVKNSLPDDKRKREIIE